MKKSDLSSKILSLADFEKSARRRLPRPIFGYINGAAEDNRSFEDNFQAFKEYFFVPRVLNDVSARSQNAEVLGKSYASPFGICPMGLLGLSSFEGDLHVVEAARDANIPCIFSGASIIPMEEIAANVPEAWFQAYIKGDSSSFVPMIERVRRAGFKTLVITVDIPVSANRENNVRTGFSTPLRPNLRLLRDFSVRPRWVFNTFVRTCVKRGMPHFENSFAQRGAPILSRHASRDFSQRDNLTWDHIRSVRDLWSGRLVMKGVLHSEDVARARDIGLDGIILSNHGGRQLDGAVSSLRMLEVVKEHAGSMTVMLDGGIRRGSDVLKALALGAQCVFLGRPFHFALATAGRAGVDHAISLLQAEIDRNQAMLGLTTLSGVDWSSLLCRVKPYS
jgi:L-lactate dehydrogenase (FMN-dependent) and related alpha-hydroxy acid dehydrogenases